MHGLGQCLLSAVLNRCAIVEEDIFGYAWTDNLLTSPELKHACKAKGRTLGLRCYLRPLSPCPRTGAKSLPGGRFPPVPKELANMYAFYNGGQTHMMEPLLRATKLLKVEEG